MYHTIYLLKKLLLHGHRVTWIIIYTCQLPGRDGSINGTYHISDIDMSVWDRYQIFWYWFFDVYIVSVKTEISVNIGIFLSQFSQLFNDKEKNYMSTFGNVEFNTLQYPLYHLLPPYRTSDLRLHGHPFQISEYDTVMHKKSFIVRSLYEYIT